MKNLMRKFNSLITYNKTELQEYAKGIKNLEKIVNISKGSLLLADPVKRNFNESFLDKERYFGFGAIEDNKFYIKSRELSDEKMNEIFPLKSLRLIKEDSEVYYSFKQRLPIKDAEVLDVFKLLIPNIRVRESNSHIHRSSIFEKEIPTKVWEVDKVELTDFIESNMDKSVHFIRSLETLLQTIGKNSNDEGLQVILAKHNPTLERIYNILEEIKETNFTLNSENVNGIWEILKKFNTACLDRVKAIELKEIEKQEKEKTLLLEAQESKQKRIEKVLDFERELQTKYLI